MLHLLHSAWYWLVLWLYRWLRRPSSASPTHHDALLIGDSNAAGFNDYITCIAGAPGLCNRLHWAAESDRRVNHTWRFVHGARHRASSYEWRVEGALYRALWSDAALRQCEVVLVMLGVGESVGDPLAELVRWDALVQDLHGRGKLVAVCRSPVSPKMDELARQVLLRKWREATERWVRQGWVQSVESSLCEMSADVLLSKRLVDFDAEHRDLLLNSAGYKWLASSWWDSLAPLLIKVQWKQWKKVL